MIGPVARSRSCAGYRPAVRVVRHGTGDGGLQRGREGVMAGPLLPAGGGAETQQQPEHLDHYPQPHLRCHQVPGRGECSRCRDAEGTGGPRGRLPGGSLAPCAVPLAAPVRLPRPVEAALGAAIAPWRRSGGAGPGSGRLPGRRNPRVPCAGCATGSSAVRPARLKLSDLSF